MPETMYYTLTELSKMLGVSVLVLREEIKAGKLKASKVGGTDYVAEPHLKAFIEGKRIKVE